RAAHRAAVAADSPAGAVVGAAGAVADSAGAPLRTHQDASSIEPGRIAGHWHSFHRPRRPAHCRPATMPAPTPATDAMYRWFESRLDPFPQDPPAQPPSSLYAFCRHYTRGTEKWLLLMALTTAGIAVAELALYAYVGS